KVENAEDTEKPLAITYHVKIPGYAQRTGKRLFFAPFYFERGVPPLFAASDRQFDIHFRYAWKESDQVIISLPRGFELDHPDAPSGLEMGKVGTYSVALSMSPKNELMAKRDLVFGSGGALAFPAKLYPTLKAAFDQVNRRDGHTISLKQSGDTAAK